ncbi:beta strand repeat-containing protein [Deinococcus koreensis]|uniref:Ig-like domain-containing protein n=1 Tax=Deinococcus koreensis TaxID=2054903 RepID=A0A2K3V0S4_9DEIO|nr:Ig-like domain-containing protein [Deinococcus koreensis]PNY82387.1 hypothetical protein CVO96_14410 [Deinococcus koreensis]
MKSSPKFRSQILWLLTATLTACGGNTPPATGANKPPEAMVYGSDNKQMLPGTYVASGSTLNVRTADADGSVTKVTYAIDGGAPANLVPSGSISLTLPTLSGGAHKVSVTVTDNAGVSSTVDAPFLVDAAAPTLDGLLLNGAAITAGSSQTLSVTDAANLSVVASDLRGDKDSTQGPVTISVFEGTRSLGSSTNGVLNVDLSKTSDNKARVAGVVTFSARATDSVGYTTSGTFSINFMGSATDGGTGPGTVTPPAFTWLSPAGTFISGGADVPLRVTATRNDQDLSSSVKYTVTCGSVNASTWTASTNCVDGSLQTITASIVDAGKTFSTTRTVTIDNSDPTVQITAPQQGQEFTQNPIKVSLTATDAVSGVASILLEAKTDATAYASVGVISQATGDVVWAPMNGTYTLRATAIDKTGRRTVSTVSGIVVRLSSTDSASPTVDALTVPGGMQRGVVSVNVTASDPSPSSGLAKVELFDGSTSLGVQTAPAGGAYTFSVDTTKLTDGVRTLRAVATDNVGRTGSRNADLSVNNAAPSVTVTSPANGALLGTTSPLTVKATGSDPTPGDTVNLSYSMDGGSFSATAPTIPATDGPHTFTVRATDGAGNIGTASSTVTYDGQAPLVQITSPATNATVTSNPVSIAVSATDNQGVDRIELSAGGSNIGTVSGAQGTLSWVAPNGAQTVTAIAYDKANNPSTPYSVALNVNLTSSSVITPTAPTVAGTTSGSNPTFVQGLGSVSGSATSTGGITGAQLIVDGTPQGTPSAASNAAPSSFTVDFSTLSEGLHQVSIRWFDKAGAVFDSSKLDTFVDKTAPALGWNSPISGSLSSKPFVLDSAANDTGAGLQAVTYSVNGAAVTSPWTPSADGVYTITATATDKVGNASSAKTSVTYDVAGPEITVTSPTNAQSVGTLPIKISATATDGLAGVSSMEALVGLQGQAPTTLGKQTGSAYNAVFSPSQAGAYEVIFKATDAAGNTSTTPPTTFTYSVTTVPAEASPNPVLSVVGGDPHTGNMSVNVSGNFDTLSTVDRMILQVTDAKGFIDNTTFVTPQSQATFSIDTTKFANGPMKLELIAYTKSGLRGITSATVNVQNILNPILAVAAPADGSTVMTPSVPVRLTLTKNGDTSFTFDPNTLVVDLLDYRGRVVEQRFGNVSTGPKAMKCVASVDGATSTCNTEFDMASFPADTYTLKATAQANVTGASPTTQIITATSKFTSNQTSVLPPAATIRFPAITGKLAPARLDSSSGVLVSVSDNTGVSVVEARMTGPFDATKPLALNGTQQCLESVPVATPVDVLMLNVGFTPPITFGDVVVPNFDIDGSARVPDNTAGQRYDLRVTTIDTEGNRNIQCIPVLVDRLFTAANRVPYSTSTTLAPTPPNTVPGEQNYESGSWKLSGLTNISRVAGVLYKNNVQQNVTFTASAQGSVASTVSFGGAGVYQVIWLVEDMDTGIVTTVPGDTVQVIVNK